MITTLIGANLQLDHQNELATRLHRILKVLGYSVAQEDLLLFAEDAVKDFQADNSIEQTGIVEDEIPIDGKPGLFTVNNAPADRPPEEPVPGSACSNIEHIIPDKGKNTPVRSDFQRFWDHVTLEQRLVTYVQKLSAKASQLCFAVNRLWM